MLYLLPNVLDEEGNSAFLIPEAIKEVVAKLDGIIAESEKGGRKFLKAFHPDFRSVPIILLNEHTTSIDALLSPLQKGERWGLISDAGLPVLADPGAKLVRRLHTLNIPIETFPGPSSIVYALQLSGLPGQRFVFNGYPPRDEKQLLERLRTLPKGETHLFIETPYRTEALLTKLLKGLQDETLLSVSWNLTLPTQGVKTDSIKGWRKSRPILGKVPAVFVLYKQ